MLRTRKRATAGHSCRSSRRGSRQPISPTTIKRTAADGNGSRRALAMRRDMPPRGRDDRACRCGRRAGRRRRDRRDCCATTRRRSLPATNQRLAGQRRATRRGARRAQGRARHGATQRPAQFGKLAERLDRTEKAQAEPAAKLAKIAESLDRLERRRVAAGRAAPTSPARSPAAKAEAKPAARPTAGTLRDFYAGRAVVESRNGRCSRSVRDRTCRGSAGSRRSSARTARWWW